MIENTLTLTIKHSQAIADIIKNYVMNSVYYIPTELINDLADYFQTENPNFDKDKFLKACGVEE